MKNFALLLIFGAVSTAQALPTLRLGDFDVRMRPNHFELTDRESGRGPLEMTDAEAFLLLTLAESLNRPLSAAEIGRRLEREGIHLENPAESAASLNARAERVLRRELITRLGERFEIDWRPRRVARVAFRPVEEGVIWRERWVDLTPNQGRFLARVAEDGRASYADLDRDGWPSRRARELVGRINGRARGNVLAIDYGIGVRVACADSLGPVAKELALFD